MTDADLLRRILGAMRPDYPLEVHDNAWLAAKGLDTLEAIEKEAAGVSLDPRPQTTVSTRYINLGGEMEPDPEGQWVHISDVSKIAGWKLDPPTAEDARPVPNAALDVERLAEAIDKHRREWPQIEYHRCTALCSSEIAREYAALEADHG